MTCGDQSKIVSENEIPFNQSPILDQMNDLHVCATNCTNRGICTLQNSTETEGKELIKAICVCQEEFASDDCSYVKKSKVRALLLSIFLGYFGADQFYLGSVEKGVAKMVLFLSICILPCCLGWMLMCTPSDRYSHVTIPTLILVLLILLAGFGWWMGDWIMIAIGVMKDGEGFPLY